MNKMYSLIVLMSKVTVTNCINENAEFTNSTNE